MSLIKYRLILIVISLCISTLVNAQSVEDIIAKHIKAHGGAEKWDAITSMEITARFTTFSEEKDFYAVKTNKGEYYSDLHIGQYEVKEAFNGTTGWTIDPWHALGFPRQLNKIEVNVFLQKAEFFSPFYKYKNKGYEVEFIGRENVDGVDTYAIKLTRSNGKEETWYLDATSYLEYKSESEWVDFGMLALAETFYDDFQTVDGVVIPFYVERIFAQRDRVTIIENIRFNTSIDQDIFEMPKSKEMNKLAFLAGKWDVQIDVRGRNNTWQTIDNTVSGFHFEADNLLKQKLSFSANYVQSMILNYTYNKSENKYRLTVYNEFSSSMDVFEGSFSDGIFSVDNTDISYGDTEAAKAALQYSIYDITEDSFMFEIKNSRDKGKTWNSAYKLYHTRK